MNLLQRKNKPEEKIPSKPRQWLTMFDYEDKGEVLLRFSCQHNVSDDEREPIDWEYLIYEVVNPDGSKHIHAEEETAARYDCNSGMKSNRRRLRVV